MYGYDRMKKKEKWMLIKIYIIIFILAVLAQFSYIGFKYPLGLSQLSFASTIYNRFFVWQSLDYSGIFTYTDTVLGMLVNLPIILSGLLFGSRASSFLGAVIFKAIAAVGGFSLVYYLTHGVKNRIRVIGSFIPVILLLFDFDFQFIGQIAFFPWVLLFIILLLSNIKSNNTKLYLFLSILALSLDMRFSWPLQFVQTIAVLLFMSFIIVLIKMKIHFKRSIAFIGELS